MSLLSLGLSLLRLDTGRLRIFPLGQVVQLIVSGCFRLKFVTRIIIGKPDFVDKVRL